MPTRLLCFLLLLSGLSLAQTAAKPSPAQTQKPPSAPKSATSPKPTPTVPLKPAPPAAQPELPPATPVVTLTGVCSKPEAGGECKTVITKGMLDQIAEVIAPGSPPQAEERLAVVAAQAMVMSSQAQKAGVESRPGVQTALDFMRNNVLSQLYVRDLQKQAANLDPAAIQAYYSQHQADYEEAKISRIYVPKTVPATDLKPEAKPLDEKAARAEADKIRQQAVASGDFKALQQAAYTDLGLKQTPPTTDMGMVRKQSLSPQQEEVFALKPGEVSAVQDLPGGFFIFKVESKTTQSLEAAKPEIQRALENDNMRQRIETISKSVKAEFNPEFFHGQAPAQLFPPPPRPGEKPVPER